MYERIDILSRPLLHEQLVSRGGFQVFCESIPPPVVRLGEQTLLLKELHLRDGKMSVWVSATLSQPFVSRGCQHSLTSSSS